MALYEDLPLTTMKFDIAVDLLSSSLRERTNSILLSEKIESLVNPWSKLAAARRLWGLILIFSRTSRYRISTELPSSTRHQWTKWFSIIADTTRGS